MEIRFSPIDCKDNYLLLGVSSMWRSLGNMTTLAIARKEYFRRLKELQDEIKVTFEPQLVEVTKDTMLSVAEEQEWRDKLDETHSIDRSTNIFYT
jgi:hypothetical protein